MENDRQVLFQKLVQMDTIERAGINRTIDKILELADAQMDLSPGDILTLLSSVDAGELETKVKELTTKDPNFPHSKLLDWLFNPLLRGEPEPDDENEEDE